MNPTIHFKSFELNEMMKSFKNHYSASQITLIVEKYRDTFENFVSACLKNTLISEIDDEQRLLFIELIIKTYRKLNPGQNVLFVTSSTKKLLKQKDELTQMEFQVEMLDIQDGTCNFANDGSIYICRKDVFRDAFVSDLKCMKSVSLLIVDKALESMDVVIGLMAMLVYDQRPRILAISSNYSNLFSNRMKNIFRNAEVTSCIYTDFQYLIENFVHSGHLCRKPEVTGSYKIEFFNFNCFHEVKKAIYEISTMEENMRIRYNLVNGRVVATVESLHPTRITSARLSKVRKI